MSDKELIELAAKAAGIECVVIEFGTLGVFKGCKSDEDFTVIFNPLYDDGDALRLALNLRIKFERHPSHPYVAAFHPHIFARFEEPEGSDYFAATRRAIVRAAAEIGGDM